MGDEEGDTEGNAVGGKEGDTVGFMLGGEEGDAVVGIVDGIWVGDTVPQVSGAELMFSHCPAVLQQLMTGRNVVTAESSGEGQNHVQHGSIHSCLVARSLIITRVFNLFR